MTAVSVSICRQSRSTLSASGPTNLTSCHISAVTGSNGVGYPYLAKLVHNRIKLFRTLNSLHPGETEGSIGELVLEKEVITDLVFSEESALNKTHSKM